MLEMLGMNSIGSAVAAGAAVALGAAIVILGTMLFGFAAAVVADTVIGAGYIGMKGARDRYLANHPEAAAE